MVNASDVFLSYARENRATAEQLADALQAQGLRVWWDRDIAAGSEFSEVIEAQLDGARVVLALWSHDSVRSAFVRDESARALKAAKLLPLRIEDVELPLGFGQIHTLDLIDWDGDTDDEAFAALLAEIRRLPGQPADAPRGGGPRLRLRRHAVVAAVLAAGLALLGWGGKALWDKDRADAHFRAGLEHQHAREPALESALNEFLSALERRPGHARARFYLARIYVLQQQPAAALEAYRLALDGSESPLDSAQRAEARRQVAALALDPDEAAPVARSATTSTLRRQTAAPKPATTVAAADRAGAPDLADSTAFATRSARGGAPAAPTATRRPPLIEPPPAAQAQLAARVDAMFDADRERRIAATAALVVDAEALSDAVPVAVAKALAALRAPPPLAPAVASGVVNTLLLLESALPATLAMHRDAIERLLAAANAQGETTRRHAAQVDTRLRAAAPRRPVAYIQYAHEAQRPVALALAARFDAFGYDTPEVEFVGTRAPARTELRVHGRSDRSLARWLTRVVAEIGEAAPAVTTLRNVEPRTDAYEIWLDRDLCAPGGRQVAACRATPPPRGG